MSVFTFACVSCLGKRIVEQLQAGELITEEEVRELCFRARDILIEEGTVQRVHAPVTV